MTEKYWYLATPYSKYAGGLAAAYFRACEVAASLIRNGLNVYCPIAHTHPIAVHGDLDPLDHTIWLPLDKQFMDGAVGLIVCRMNGWEESYGIGEEIKVFKAASKPVVYMDQPESAS